MEKLNYFRMTKCFTPSERTIRRQSPRKPASHDGTDEGNALRTDDRSVTIQGPHNIS